LSDRLLAHLSPVSGLTVCSCSCDRALVPRCFQAGLAASPLRFSTVVVTLSGNLVPGCKSWPMPGTLGGEFIRLFRALCANEFAPTINRIILFIPWIPVQLLFLGSSACPHLAKLSLCCSPRLSFLSCSCPQVQIRLTRIRPIWAYSAATRGAGGSLEGPKRAV